AHKHEHEDEHDDGHEHDHSHDVFDEHIWTSPVNAAKITKAIGDMICSLDIPDADKETYRTNTDTYIDELDKLDESFEAFFESCDNKVLVFGDRFPFRYFVEEYELDYYAAFPGCSGETEMSAANLVFLIDKVKADKVSTVFYIEFSNQQVAKSIAESTDTVTALLHSCHNVSKAEIDGGATYLSLMSQNLNALKEALD
nr:zinc ABC transporter substrate-binding protein [Clostridia bacterium]